MNKFGGLDGGGAHDVTLPPSGEKVCVAATSGDSNRSYDCQRETIEFRNRE